MEDLISVIIPVYNVEAYLDKCVISVVNQTYQNLEIILVNDGSLDQCSRMCDEWALRDDRIKVIHKENGGLSEARNAALDICTGKYITFVDSDDYVEEEYVEFLYHLIVKYNAEVAVCELSMKTANGKEINHCENSGEEMVFDQEQALWQLCNESLFSNSACGKLYMHDHFKDIRYPVGRLFEDIATTYKLFLKSSVVSFGERALYNYIRRDGSIMISGFHLQKLDAVEYVEKMCDAITQKWPKLTLVARKRRFVEYIYTLRSAVLAQSRTKEVLGIEETLYQKIKVVRKGICRAELTPKFKYYVICSFGGRYLLRLAIHLENYLYQLIKLRK